MAVWKDWVHTRHWKLEITITVCPDGNHCYPEDITHISPWDAIPQNKFKFTTCTNKSAVKNAMTRANRIALKFRNNFFMAGSNTQTKQKHEKWHQFQDNYGTHCKSIKWSDITNNVYIQKLTLVSDMDADLTNNIPSKPPPN